MPVNTKRIIHLIANAHLDPVWLWDWREGLNAALCTVRSVLALMDEFPELTFIRGEAAIYEHVERYDPEAFARIRQWIHAGRWDVVGGTWIQPDTNLPATETLCRHLLRGQRYFANKFGKPVRVAWAADSFGHSSGLPDVFAAAGIDSFAFTRPSASVIPLPEPAFWWSGAGGSKVLAYRPLVGAYLTEREDLPRRLDETLLAAESSKLSNIACFYGLGDHGGGPTRRHLHDIRRWAEQHPQVSVIHSGLHRLFDAVRGELAAEPSLELPVHEGELNFVFRGCYAAAARMKFAYRRAEAAISRAERVSTACSLAIDDVAALSTEAWDSLLFNSFHDILPGSSIERAYDEQLEWLGGAVHQARCVELDALNRLAWAVDTAVPIPSDHDAPANVAMLAFNPHAHEFRGHVEFEACLDDRPLTAFKGRPGDVPISVYDDTGARLPHQAVATEHRAFASQPWRSRVVVPVILPPMGWKVLRMGYAPNDDPPALPDTGVCAAGSTGICNEWFAIDAPTGPDGIRILRGGEPFLVGPLTAATFEDPWGSWGNMGDGTGPQDLGKMRERWHIHDARVLERGPQRAALWVRLAGPGSRSRLDLTFYLYHGRDAVDVSARLMWDERAALLKLLVPAGAPRAIYDVPGGTATRGSVGEVPGGRWVIAGDGPRAIGFASDSLYSFDLDHGSLRPTIVRAAPFAATERWSDPGDPWVPAFDAGEHRFRFILAPGDLPKVRRLADELVQSPLVQLVPAGSGGLPRTGSFLRMHPPTLQVLAVKPSEDRTGLVLRGRNADSAPADAELTILGRIVVLGTVPAGSIITWLVEREASSGTWKTSRIPVTELRSS